MTSSGTPQIRLDTLLRADRVGRTFGGFIAVDDVTMSVGPGEVVGLLGANGAGKTTLIRMLLGLISTTTGDVELLGGAPDRERRTHLGYVPQGLGLYGDLTVRENLAFSTQAYGVVTPDLTGALRSGADRLVAELPLGLQRQLAFLSALAVEHQHLGLVSRPPGSMHWPALPCGTPSTSRPRRGSACW
jgi:ABC-2 type transport system ATP-binding protein